MFAELKSLPAELLQPILAKFSPTSYTKFRRSCHEANELAHFYSRQLAIQPRQHARLYLLDSFRNTICFDDLLRTEGDLPSVYVLIDYGDKRWDSNLKIRMISENVSIIRQAIEGFSFDELVVSNSTHSLTYQFNKAFPYFLEVIRGRNFRWLTAANLSDDKLDQLTATVKFNSLTLFYKKLEKRHLELTKRVTKTLFLNWGEPLPREVDIFELIKNKKNLLITVPHRSMAIMIWKMTDKIIKNWSSGSLRYVRFIFEEYSAFYYANLEKTFYRLGAVHMGSFQQKDVESLSSGNSGETAKKIDIFIFPQSNFYIILKRCKLSYSVKMTFSDRMEISEMLATTISSNFVQAAVNPQLLTKRLKGKSLERMKCELQAFDNKIERLFKIQVVEELELF